MKNILKFAFAFFIGLFTTSCQNQSNPENTVKFFQNSEELYGQIDLNKNSQTKAKKIEFKTITDAQKNMPICFMPLPNDWIVNQTIDKNDNISITGPNNIKVYSEMLFSYFYSSDPYINQSMQQKGFNISPKKSIDQLIKEIFEPYAKSQGSELVKTYKLPKLIAYDKNYDQFTFKSAPQNNKTFDVVATEWTNNKGTLSLSIIHYSTIVDQYQQENWYYYIQSIECDANSFEQAKQEYLYALANTKYNPDWLQYHYMKDAETARKNNKIHIERMGQLRAEGEAIIKRGKEYSLAVDKRHEKFMDAHLERETVSTTSGQSYKVDAGSNYYWINSDGQYISSNNPNYNPNTDPNYNNINWKSTSIKNN